MADPTFPVYLLEIGLALLASVLSGLLLTPMTRTTRSYMAASTTPDWAKKRISITAGTRLLLNVNLLLPGLVSLIWVSFVVQAAHVILMSQVDALDKAMLDKSNACCTADVLPICSVLVVFLRSIARLATTDWSTQHTCHA